MAKVPVNFLFPDGRDRQAGPTVDSFPRGIWRTLATAVAVVAAVAAGFRAVGPFGGDSAHSAGAAGAGPATATAGPASAGPRCPLPYLATPRGPSARCTWVDGDRARPGWFDARRGGFEPAGPDVTVVEDRCYSFEDGSVRGCVSVATDFGPVVYATQYAGSRGRWGRYNMLTEAFYPDGDWLPIAR